VASKKSFPDLTGDGKVTKKDILKGRGVKGFEKGGSVRPAPIEMPISDDPLIQAIEEERRIQEANEPEEPKKKKLKRRGDDEEVKKFAMGGSVCAGAGSAMRGKKFSGTY
jgi:hypothetical protein